ncbi:MAG: hypothetical protein ACLGSA_08465 [Acidobacteriota bacterium]
MRSIPPVCIATPRHGAPQPFYISGRAAALLPALLLALLAVFTAGGCAPHVSLVRVEAQANPETSEPTEFAILPGQKDEDTSGHAYVLHSRALAAELVRRGYTQARTRDTAHVSVTLRFGLVGEEVPHQGMGLEHLFVLDIEAVDALAARAGRPTPTLWKVTATAHGHLDQRETVFKTLLAASAPFIGQQGEANLQVHRDPVAGTYEFIPR